MTRTIGRTWLVILAVIALFTLTAFVVSCGDDADGGTTSSTDSTTTSESTNETTIVEGGKSLDEYRAEVPELEQALETDPQDLSALEQLAVAHYQLGEYDQAAEAYKKILTIVDDAFIHNALGNVYRDQEKFDEAIAEYQTSIKLDPSLKFPYINMAGIYKMQGDIEKAIAILKQAESALNAEDTQTVKDYQDMLTSTTTT